nr:PREDICTED: RING finger protein nhl-1 isoform X1 [Bemisia tabaci]
MEQFEQLLTCAICLDRYRNPKLLPCQHSFCMEPCMDGLVDYVRRQVKCPECRAEHRIPYQGVQGYPTNVTLQRFLELHIEITGELPDPTSGQTMKRCGVCSEKAYVTICVHCDKEICTDCKGAHMDILRREISRINNQVRRAMHRLQDILAVVEKNMLALQLNCTSVSEEVDEIYKRLAKALKDRTEYLRGEIDRYLTTELKNLSTLKENLQQEISNIQANCDLANKEMQSEEVEWDDCELMDAKEIFLKTIDFIRNFEAETGDYNRRVRFAMAHDPNQLVLHVAGYGELTIHMPHQPLVGFNTSSPAVGSNMLQPPGPGLMRSKSDHRLASQFRAQEDRGGYDNVDQSGRVSPLGGRKFGERYTPRSGGDRYDNRYRGVGSGEYGDYTDSTYGDGDNNRLTTRSRLRSRFGRHTGGDDSDNDGQSGRTVRFLETHVPLQSQRERERVLDTEDVSKGPLSGITRLYDSPRVMKRIQDSKTKDKRKPSETPAKTEVQSQRKAAGAMAAPVRQVSEEDEISRIKRQNKASSSSETTTETMAPARTMVSERVASLKREESKEPTSHSTLQPRKTSASVTADSSEDESDDESGSSPQQCKTPVPTVTKATSRRSSASSDATTTSQSGGVMKKGGRSASADSSTSSESSTGSHSALKNTGAVFTTEERKQQFLARSRKEQERDRECSRKTLADTSDSTDIAASVPGPTHMPRLRASSQKDSVPTTPTLTQKWFQNRLIGGTRESGPTTTSLRTKPKEPDEEEGEEEEESETSSESEETSDSSKSEDETEPIASAKTEKVAPMEKTDIGPLLARSANARDTTMSRKSSRDEGYKSSRYGTNDSSYRSPYQSSKDSETASTGSKYTGNRNKFEDSDSVGNRYGAGSGNVGTAGSSGFTSRFLSKSKSSAVVSPEEEEARGANMIGAGASEESRFPLGRTRFAAFKDRKARLARSKSTHTFGVDEFDDFDDASYSPSVYLASKNAALTPGHELSRSRSSHALKSRESSPERSATATQNIQGGEKDGAALSSWARYLKNKYGNRDRGKESKEGAAGASGTSGGASGSVGGVAGSSVSRRLSVGLPLRHNSTSIESSDDDQKNTQGSPHSPTSTIAATAATPQQAGFTTVGSTPKSQYMQKRRQLFKIGSRGSEPGYFTWPRGIAVGPDNSIVVADSSNHRVQVFDSNGIFLKEFGSYGNAEGEFDCLAGIAVNRIGQYIIADRYNHRVQVLDPSGRFLRAFGSQGTTDGKFNYPWGVTTDALGFIYVCDKENHRIQVFQSDGTFVGKFGSNGSKLGQLEHPHYIAISNTNRVIVSDSNNHRVQVFDVNGRVLSSFGTEGSEQGQFKFPRGVAVDDQGFISVGDSGNNRIQIFNPDGSFLKAFGCWGSGDGEFKGLEGVAVMSNGNILVCDRENHRIQVF